MHGIRQNDIIIDLLISVIFKDIKNWIDDIKNGFILISVIRPINCITEISKWVKFS